MSDNTIPILMYHSISEDVHPLFSRYAIAPQQFREQMSYLSRARFHPITVTQLIHAIRSGTPLPTKPLVLTFDDGFEDFYTCAFPVIREYHFSATLFLVSHFIGHSSRWLQKEGEAAHPILTWRELSEISSSGIECGGHSHTHPPLDQIPTAQAREEIRQCKRILEDHLGQAVSSFAYPFGYYNRAIRQMVEEAGYSGACAVRHTISSTSDDPLALRRVIITADMDLSRFAKLLSRRSTPVDWAIRDVRETTANFLRRQNLYPRVQDRSEIVIND